MLHYSSSIDDSLVEMFYNDETKPKTDPTNPQI